MSRKRFVYLSVAVMVSLLVGRAAALKVAPFHYANDEDEQWKPLGGGPIGQDWSNPENWWHNVLPTSAQKAKVNRVPGPIIDSPVNIYQLFVSEGNLSAFEYSPCTLQVLDGANLQIGQVAILGYYPLDTGILQIDGGTVNIASHLFVGRMGKGKLVMNGGDLTVGGNFAVAFQGGDGRVELNGGTLHINQLTYEFAFTEADPNIPLPGGPGIAAIDLSGGSIVHSGTAVPAVYQQMIDAGKLTAYHGKGDVIVRFDAATQQTTVTGQKLLWNYSDINVSASSIVVDEGWSGLDRMFKASVTDPNATIFLDDPAGAVYFVEWQTAGPVTVESIEMTAERDNESGVPPFGRAVRHFTLKARSAGSPTYDQVLYNGDITYTTNVTELIYALPEAVTAQDFRAEFTGNDIRGVRIRRLNASGTRTVDQRWNFSDLTMTAGGSPVVVDPNQPGAFDLANMFENQRLDNLATIFMDGAGVDPVYTVVFRPVHPGDVRSIEFVAEHDNMDNGYQRAVKHFKLKAKSIGSDIYDRVLYDADIAVPYQNNVFRTTFDVPGGVIAYEYCAEFTGNDALGVRVRELNAFGTDSDIEPVWNPDNVIIGNRTPFQVYNEFYDVDNMFQKSGEAIDPNFASTIFEDFPADSVYYVEWKTKSRVCVNTVHLLATHDAVTDPITPMKRAMKQFVLKAKSAGSTTYDLTLYSGAVAVPYNAPYNPAVLDKWINLAVPVVASEFRAEFTGNDNLGIRLGELDALGTILPNVAGDLNDSSDVDLDDFAVLAGNWALDNSGTMPMQSLETFESYASLPNTVWFNWDGQTSSYYNKLYLETGIVKSGTKALKWTYDLDPGVVTGDDKSGLVYKLATPVDLRNYSKMRVWIYRDATNSLENYLGVKFMWSGTTDQPHDSKTQAEAMILSANGSSKTPGGVWTEWVIDLKNDLVFRNRSTTGADDIYDVGSIIFYLNNRQEFRGGMGTLWLDEIRLEQDCVSPEADLNDDCKVDINDLAVLVGNWLVGK
ncbi:MAG: hypothetical protein LLF76_13760 [Planctomycetaceae bacterium]|nr:hypothetical protein [Planctomycetaceae bacterium]